MRFRCSGGGGIYLSMALPGGGGAADVSVCCYSRNNFNKWRRPITLVGGLVIPQPHLINNTSNLKSNRVSAAAAAASSQIIIIMLSSMRNNYLFPSTRRRDGSNNTSSSSSSSSSSHLSLNWYHMITTPTAIHTSKHHHHHHQQQQPVLLFDIMDTIVRDPFYQDVPAFFQMSFKELIHSKHPTAWIDFELGFIDEMELARNFFKDGRPLDLEGLKNCMRSGYSYIEGMEELLSVLKQNNYEMHALTNYPIWYEMIEDKLKLSTYLSWSFCSCTIGKRKPDLEFYAEVVRRLDVEPENCIFIDDRMRNVEAAAESGMVGLQFKDAKTLCYELSLLGIQTKSQEDEIVS